MYWPYHTVLPSHPISSPARRWFILPRDALGTTVPLMLHADEMYDGIRALVGWSPGRSAAAASVLGPKPLWHRCPAPSKKLHSGASDGPRRIRVLQQAQCSMMCPQAGTPAPQPSTEVTGASPARPQRDALRQLSAARDAPSPCLNKLALSAQLIIQLPSIGTHPLLRPSKRPFFPICMLPVFFPLLLRPFHLHSRLRRRTSCVTRELGGSLLSAACHLTTTTHSPIPYSRGS